MAFFEKFWNCHACGKTGISALRSMKCPGCGSVKSSQDEEYLTNKEITDQYGLELAKGKPHWTCSHCGSVNLDKETNCYGCGNERENSDQNNKIIDLGPITLPEPESNNTYNRSPAKPESKRLFPTSDYQDNHKKVFSLKSLASKKSLYVTIAILTLAILGWLLLHTVTVEARVVNFSWTRTISIEKYQTVHESGWYLESGSYNTWSETRLIRNEPIYQTKTRIVHHPQTSYRDLGNGAVQSYDSSYTTTETYQEIIGYKPIYGTWYEYDVDKWIFDRNETSTANDQKPYWPNYNLNLDGYVLIGAERIGGKTELYQVLFETINKNKDRRIFTYNVNQDEWNKYQVDITYELKINHLGMITNNPLKDKESR